jgi:hypothetical protein
MKDLTTIQIFRILFFLQKGLQWMTIFVKI